MSGDRQSLATIRSLQKLEDIIHCYQPHWEVWTQSPFAPLSTKELSIINSYRSTKSHHAYAIKSRNTTKHVASAYHHAIRKLTQRNTLQTFEKWRTLQTLVASGISQPDYNVNSFVEPAARVQLPYSGFVEIYSGLATGKAFIMGGTKLKQLTGLSKAELQEIHKSQLRITIYLSNDG